MDIREFLSQFETLELINIGVLNSVRNLLNSKSVDNIIQLMKQKNVDKLEGPGDWFLDINYNFCNPKSSLKQYGNLKKEQTRLGVVFDYQNKILNPYYNPTERSGEKKSLIQKQYTKHKINLDKTVFANEDISKPENRINLSLFGLFLNDEFRHWFLNRLVLPINAVIFPSANLKGGIRPDFAVYNKNCKPIAYIEVEIGNEDIGQLQNFRSLLNVTVLSICGKKEYKGNLSLIEIYEELIKIKQKINSKQFEKNLAVYETLIYENVLSYGSERYRSTTISENMKETPIVKELFSNLNISENVERSLYPGEFLMETKKEYGFSLRIYSRESTVRNSLAVMSQTGGRPEIIFPSKKKLEKYLHAEKQDSINEYAQLLKRIGCPIDNLPETKQGRIKIQSVENNINSLISVIRKLGAL